MSNNLATILALLIGSVFGYLLDRNRRTSSLPTPPQPPKDLSELYGFLISKGYTVVVEEDSEDSDIDTLRVEAGLHTVFNLPLRSLSASGMVTGLAGLPMASEWRPGKLVPKPAAETATDDEEDDDVGVNGGSGS